MNIRNFLLYLWSSPAYNFFIFQKSKSCKLVHSGMYGGNMNQL